MGLGEHMGQIAGTGTTDDTWYVYRVLNRQDGMEYAAHRYVQPSRCAVLFWRALDCQEWMDGRRAAGEGVFVLPSADGFVS